MELLIRFFAIKDDRQNLLKKMTKCGIIFLTIPLSERNTEMQQNNNGLYISLDGNTVHRYILDESAIQQIEDTTIEDELISALEIDISTYETVRKLEKEMTGHQLFHEFNKF